jgi:thiamine biosynthesis protein ThiS
MRLVINGEEQVVDLEAPNVARLLDLRQPRPPFAVEVNQQLVRRPAYEATPLRDGDRVEIVTLVGGG